MASMQPIQQSDVEKFTVVMDRKDISWGEKYKILWRTQHVPTTKPEVTIRSHLEWMRSMQR